MKTEKVSNLKKALFVLLFDQYNCPDLELYSSDDIYIDYIIGALIETNGDICPFKNYSCIGNCKSNVIECAYGLKMDCKRKLEDAWKEFIEID